ncbi:DUF4296 domain-containing protein [Mucilaginibacter panaciglaebae]|uniref:DUF4296 domain-containing protein n=1 Tax=Mucilaginibacter panaciglaebae TaxID=502331 RepID=A0ABP7X286_9SPHI
MRKHIILFFSALLFLFACNNDKDAKGVLGRDEMVNLLVDVHLVDGSLLNQPNGDSLYRNGTGRYFYVFKQHHTDSAQFRKSMAYYVSHPDVMIPMYDDIAKILQAKSDSINALVAKDNEITRRRMERLQKKTQKGKQDSSSDKMKDDAKKIQLNLIDKERRMRMSQPLPNGKNIPRPVLNHFKRGQ